MNFAVQFGLNTTSFGNVAYCLARSIFERGLAPCIFPIGQPDFSAQKPDQDFQQFLQTGLSKALNVHDRNNPVISLWHCNDLLLKPPSKEQIAITFLEVDNITKTEYNILRNQKIVFVTSTFLKQVMEDAGLTNVKYLQLGFDHWNFKRIDKKFYDDDRIVFSLNGKWEKRKHTEKIIKTWLKRFGCPKYGQRPKYFLHVAAYNPFRIREQNGQRIDDNQRLIAEALEGKEYSNIVFYGWMVQNDIYNSYLQSSHIVLGLSGGECIDLPSFHSVALGKHAVILNAHGYSDWSTSLNSVLIEPSSKIPAADGIFFHQNSQYQVGNFFDWSEDAMIHGCEEAIKRVEADPVNHEGLKLQSRNYSQTLDQLLAEL